jgi:hypothetical protein
MTDGFAYSTDAPDVVAVYRQALADRDAFMTRTAADLDALGAGPCVNIRSSSMPGGRERVTAIQMQGDTIPDGWRLVSTELVPRRGKPGEAARAWLVDHQPVDVLHALEGHGLPRTCWTPGSHGGAWLLGFAKVLEHDGTLWAFYRREPGSSGAVFDTERCTWTPRKLSEYYAAVEAKAARQIGAAA